VNLEVCDNIDVRQLKFTILFVSVLVASVSGFFSRLSGSFRLHDFTLLNFTMNFFYVGN